ncbi:MAG TPA: BTAD domain-containing putative transcriptional regulator [Gemmatimonadaceae bacterium]|nr:BTAD domain-containing putative transcriptional regulator [Gemmatimonadaceae bacterium]
MTHTSAKLDSADHYRLRTFGTLALTGRKDDTHLGKHGHQRRRLALLAVLAAAGEQGRSRDQLLLLFWPDATQSHARHSLEQLLYAIRGSIDEAVFAGVNPVHLNTDVVSSDVGEFQGALQRGDLEGAVQEYQGPFLDGFYLTDAPEFDQWLGGERARLERNYTGALVRLAQSADAAQDYATAVRWWRKLAETDPVSGKNAAGLIRALMNSGDHAAALQYAERYEAVVAQELGTSVGPAVANLVAEVRVKAKSERVAVPKSQAQSSRARQHAAPVGADEMPVDQLHARHSARRRSVQYAIGAFAVVAIISTAVWWRASLDERTLGPVKHGSTHNVAAYELYLRGNDPVLYRTDSGARAGLEYFRQAVALDPNYAAAYAGLARMQKRIAFGDDPQLSRPDRLALAEQAALKAIALDDSSGEAHEALGYVRRDNYELTSAETEFKRAVALDPTNSRFHEGLVQIYTMTQRPDEALVEAHRAVQLDPLSPTANAEVADALLASDRCDEALSQLETLKSLQPPLNRANLIAAECYGQKEMWPEAIAEIQGITVNGGPRVYALLGYTLGRAGHTVEARQILAVMLDRSRRTKGGAFDVALVYAGLGENDQAFTWLDKAVDDRSLGFEWMHTTVNGLRRDPRFEKLGQRVGLPKSR